MRRLSSRRVVSLVVGAVAMALLGIFAPRVVLVGWLSAIAPLTAAMMGAALLACMLKLGRARLLAAWQAPLETSARALLVAPLLCLPLVFGVHTLYGWAADPEFAAQRGYLNVPFFVVRALLYFGVWIGVAIAWPMALRPARLAVILLILFVVANLSGIDWIMALTPAWHSSDFGLRWVLNGLMIATACAAAWQSLRMRGGSDDDLRARIDGATLLFALHLGWLYLAFVDYVTAWSGNLPDEAAWYLPRLAGVWGVVAAALVAVHVIAGALLLSRRFKRVPRAVLAVALLTIAAQWVESLWTIIPGLPVNALQAAGVSLCAIALVATVAIGADGALKRIRPMETAHG